MIALDFPSCHGAEIVKIFFSISIFGLVVGFFFWLAGLLFGCSTDHSVLTSLPMAGR